SRLLRNRCPSPATATPRASGTPATNADAPRPLSRANMRRTSSRVRTTGTRSGRLARTNASNHPTGTSITSRYKNTNADSAWFCVDALTRRSTARQERKRVTSPSPSSRGCRRPENRTNRRTTRCAQTADLDLLLGVQHRHLDDGVELRATSRKVSDVRRPCATRKKSAASSPRSAAQHVPDELDALPLINEYAIQIEQNGSE